MLARIYRPAKNAMQSGKAATKVWLLEFEPKMAPRAEPLMGWISSADPDGQVRIRFESKDAAIEFARSHSIPHQVIETSDPARQIKSYSDNFAFRRREPWSH